MGDPIKQDEGKTKGKPKVKPVGNPEQQSMDNIRAVLLFAFFSAAVRLLALVVQRRNPA
ncbi:GL24297 [Drosophila persimilis]|uniref:GL24297 n=1 Tax=Drosophila persimilis TaxID=7234 RepID=B4HCZ7_DROPE|nr:GL24297 [Drosophila persimilis]